MNKQLRKIVLLLAFGLLAFPVFGYDFDDTATVDLSQTVNGNVYEWTASLRVYGYNSQGYQQIWVVRDSGFGYVQNTAYKEDGSSTSTTGVGDMNGIIVYSNFFTRFTMNITLNDGTVHSLSVGTEPANPCGPLDFSKTYTNPTSKTEWYRAYIGSTFIDFFIVPPYGAHTFEFHQDEACDKLYIIKELDGEPLIPMDEQAPSAPDPAPNPEFPELGEPPPPAPEFEDTDVGGAAGSGNVDENGEAKSDVEKLVESQWILWKGTDDRLKDLQETLDKSGEKLGDIEGVFEDGIEGLSGDLSDIESGIDGLGDELSDIGDTLEGIEQGQQEDKGIIEQIKNFLFGWNEDIEDGKNRDFEDLADSRNGYAATMVDSINLPEVDVATQTFTPSSAAWPTFDLPVIGTINTDPFARFPFLTSYGAICRNVLLVIIWLLFLKKIGRDCKDYSIGMLATPATNVNTGGENIAFPVHLAKSLAKSAAIIVTCTAFATGIFVILNFRSTAGGMSSIQSAFTVDIASQLALLGPFAGFIDTFIPIAPLLFFMMAGIAFPFLCLPLFFLSAFIVRLIPL